MTAARSRAQVTAPNRAEWLARLNAIGQGDWRTARAEVARIGGIAPDKATGLITGLWPELTVPAVKKELLDMLFNADLPYCLRVARLAVDDKSPEVWEGLRGVLLTRLGLDFGQDREQYRRWIESHQNQDYKGVRQQRVREVVGQLRTIAAFTPEERQSFLRRLADLSGNPELRETAVRAGLFTVVQKILRDEHVSPDIRVGVLRILTPFSLNEEYLRNTVWPIAHTTDQRLRQQALLTMAEGHYRPAYVEIKAALIEDLHAEGPHNMSLARALASYGDPEAIPFLIGLIAADNADTIYNVGYFALGQLLTGVPYSATHDGNWWRIWWERNRSQLPAGVRDLPIPELPRSRAYRDPRPKDQHLDPTRLRDALIQQLATAVQHGQKPNTSTSNVQNLAETGDPVAIPALIGAIAADNSHDAIYDYGYFGLTPLTGVAYSVLHDGNWWKLWWKTHRAELPESVRDLPIPDYGHGDDYHEPIPMEVHQSTNAVRGMLLARLRNAMETKSVELSSLCNALTALKDPRIVPDVIQLIPEDPNDSSIYWLTYFGIGPLTKVRYAQGRGRSWWQDWWKQNESEFRKQFNDAPKQPDFITESFAPRQRGTVPPVTEIGYQPRIFPAGAAKQPEPDAEDVKDISSERFFANGDKNKTYRLVGLSREKPVPASGYKLLVLLPGGDGSEEFRWFVQRIKKYALPADVLIAQLVAPNWSDWQTKNLVWPTRVTPFYGMKFPTEQFIDNVIADVSKKTHIDPANICTLAWSSSGPAVYTHSATTKTSIRGAFIAMSVFRSGELPDPATLKNRRFFIYHSPQDFIPITQAKEAVDYLTTHGAHVKMKEYEGGHGWAGNVYEDIRTGIAWLYAGN